MDTTTSTLLAGAIVVVGRWVEGEHVGTRIVVGIIGTALAVSLIGNANDKLGRTFGLLVLVTAVFRYAVPILQKTGLIGK